MSDFDYKAQLEHLLSHQWSLVTERIGLPQHGSTSTQPIQERLSCTLESLAEQGRTPEEAVGVINCAICSVLGDKWETEVKMLLQGVEWKKTTYKAQSRSKIPVPSFGKGRASTGLTARCSTPTLFGASSNSPNASATSSQHQHVKRCASSGQLRVPRPMRSADVSSTSISESGYNSLSTSGIEAQLRQVLQQDAEHLQTLTPSGTPQKSTSCPETPRHQGSSSTSSLPPLQHSSPLLSPSQSHTALAQSKSLGSSPTTSLTEIIQKPIVAANGNLISPTTGSSTKVLPNSTKYATTQVHRHSELPTVFERGDCVQSELESLPDLCPSGGTKENPSEIRDMLTKLTEKVEDLAAREHPSPKMTNREVQTDLEKGKRGRVYSDSKAIQMIQRKPKLGQTHKAHSEGDMDNVTTDLKVMKSYSPLPSIREPTRKEEKDVRDFEGVAISTSVKDDPLQQCLPEDVTKDELVTIAGEISRDTLCRLCTILHKKTHVYDDLCHRYPHSSHEDIAFRVLQSWYESVSPGSANRIVLVTAFKKLGKLRVSHAIATKSYNN